MEAKKKRATSPHIPKEVRSKRGEEQRVKMISSIVLGELRSVIKHFPSYDQLPPFYQELLDVRIDKNKYKKSLGAVQWCVNNIEDLKRKSYGDIKFSRVDEKIKRSNSSQAFMGRCASFIKQISCDLDRLVEIKVILAEFPEIQNQPTLVIAGFPNVGKSTFLRTLTGSGVKIAPYPFTTQEIYIGHIKPKYLTYQIIDTPGLLDRPMEDRNPVELQAILAMKHLADVMLFILDPTGNVDEQFSLIAEVRKNFPSALITIAVNKTDLIADKKKLENIHDKLIKNKLTESKPLEMCANDYESVLAVFQAAEKLFTGLDKYKY
jgi:nucleolar GTP-binding protein